jgi:membrane protein
VGSFITSVFFSLGKTAIGIYLGNRGVTSSFGAAGSLVLLLLWIYYSAQILFFGAEFTQVYANKYGSKIVPEGKEETAQPELKGTRDLRGRPALLASAVIAITSREKQLEKENRQTARFLLGLVITSFFTGIFTAIFGLKKR